MLLPTLAGVLLLSPLLTSPAVAKRISCGPPSTSTQRIGGALVASDHDTMSVFTGRGIGSPLEAFVNRGPAYSKMAFRGDNVEAGDYFPTGSCDVVMLSGARHVYRVFAGSFTARRGSVRSTAVSPQGPHALEEPGVGAPGGAAKPQR